MLQVIIPEIELFDDDKQEFIKSKGGTLQLEHSLLSLSKWESKWNKPFLSKDDKSNEELLDYIKCMTINQNISLEIYDNIPTKVFNEITTYITSQMTATTFNEQNHIKKSREKVTAEIIYYWMIAQNIPLECQKWHLNRLLTLIRVCSIKNNPSKKMSRKEILAQQRGLNASRREKFNTKG